MIAQRATHSLISTPFLIGFLSLVIAPFSLAQDAPDFCWLSTYGRGVGSIPNGCPEGREQRGLLCYSKCAEGFAVAPLTVDCHQQCPPGWRDDGLFCRLAEYGRGAGYPWQFGDPLNDSNQWSRCEADHGVGNCEKDGLILYPKCGEGFSPFGCCICRPNVPDCSALGFSTQFDLSCGKTITIGDPTLRECAPGLEYDAGLCYTPCDEGYDGIGPVCWGQPPPNWVHCGFGASPDDGACATVIADQVLSVGEAVIFVASLGTSAAAQPIIKGGSKWDELVAIFRDVQTKLPNIFENHPDAQAWYELANLGKSGYDIAMLDPNTQEPEDLVRFISTLTAFFDPTGVSSIIAAYTYAPCNDILDNL